MAWWLSPFESNDFYRSSSQFGLRPWWGVLYITICNKVCQYQKASYFIDVLWFLLQLKRITMTSLNKSVSFVLYKNEQLFSCSLAGTSYISMGWWWCMLCTRPKRLAGFALCQLLETTVRGCSYVFILHAYWWNIKKYLLRLMYFIG